MKLFLRRNEQMSTDSRQSIIDTSKWDYHQSPALWTNCIGVVYKNMDEGLLTAAEVTAALPKPSSPWVASQQLGGCLFQVSWLLWTSRQHSLSNGGSHHSVLLTHWVGEFGESCQLQGFYFLSLRSPVQAEMFQPCLEHLASLQLSLQSGRI